VEEKTVTANANVASRRESKVPTNFLLGCSESSLGNFELVSLATFNDLRGELHATLDRMIEEMTKANLARWFLKNGRANLLAALQNGGDPVAWAKEEIRRNGRSQAEMDADDNARLLSSLEPGAAHLAASLRYQQRNIAEGKCMYCPKPLDRNSVAMCTDHLRKARERARKKKKLSGESHTTLSASPRAEQLLSES